jgi:hypothetical protein
MNPWYRYAALAIFLLAVGSVLFGIYAVIRQEGYAVYFVLFGMAFIFYTMSAQVLPTGRNNRRYADGRWQKNFEEVTKKTGNKYPKVSASISNMDASFDKKLF